MERPMAKTAYPGKGRAAFWDNQLAGGGRAWLSVARIIAYPPADCIALLHVNHAQGYSFYRLVPLLLTVPGWHSMA